MLNYSNIDLKVCGITTSQSILTAANHSIRSLGFASNNLFGPNTCNDELIKNLIEFNISLTAKFLKNIILFSF